MKWSTSRPGSTATYGSDSSSSLAYGQSHKVLNAGKIIWQRESKVEGQTGSNVKSTLIEKEMKQLEKIKFKQVSLP